MTTLFNFLRDALAESLLYTPSRRIATHLGHSGNVIFLSLLESEAPIADWEYMTEGSDNRLSQPANALKVNALSTTVK